MPTEFSLSRTGKFPFLVRSLDAVPDATIIPSRAFQSLSLGKLQSSALGLRSAPLRYPTTRLQVINGECVREATTSWGGLAPDQGQLRTRVVPTRLPIEQTREHDEGQAAATASDCPANDLKMLASRQNSGSSAPNSCTAFPAGM